jgi:hypothetical protein
MSDCKSLYVVDSASEQVDLLLSSSCLFFYDLSQNRFNYIYQVSIIPYITLEMLHVVIIPKSVLDSVFGT